MIDGIHKMFESYNKISRFHGKFFVTMWICSESEKSRISPSLLFCVLEPSFQQRPEALTFFIFKGDNGTAFLRLQRSQRERRIASVEQPFYGLLIN